MSEHEFDPTPMNILRCWRCGLEKMFEDSPTFYISNDEQLWAKTDKGDELVTPMNLTPDGPCSCLAHRTENCSECYPGVYVNSPDVSMNMRPNRPRPNPSFGPIDIDGPSLPVPPTGHYGFAPGQVVLSVPKGYMAFPAGMNPTINSSSVDSSVAGPSDDDEFETVGQMTVDEMLASITDITEAIYPNQSASLLPKFELVIRALYEQAGDAVVVE